MIKIPSSYKIIKKENISSIEEFKVVDTKIDTEFEDELEEQLGDIVPDKEEKETYDLEEIKREVKKVLYKEMEEKRDNIIQQAYKKAEELKIEAKKQGFKEGHNQGYENGYKEGLRKAQDEAIVIKNNALSLIQQSEDYVSQYLDENKEKIIQLAADMAESIVHHTIETSSENIFLLIKPILQSYDKKDNIIISCNLENYDYIKENLQELKDICPGSKFVILKDNNLEKNNCIIENEHQIIDLQIKNQIKSILEEIKDLE